MDLTTAAAAADIAHLAEAHLAEAHLAEAHHNQGTAVDLGVGEILRDKMAVG